MSGSRALDTGYRDTIHRRSSAGSCPLEDRELGQRLLGVVPRCATEWYARLCG